MPSRGRSDGERGGSGERDSTNAPPTAIIPSVLLPSERSCPERAQNGHPSARFVQRDPVTPRRVILLFNPVSGSGRAARLADEARRHLAALGHDVVPAATRREDPREWLPALLADREVAVVVGGDGALRLTLGCLAEVSDRLAVWHHPAGTENLFARAFRMEASPETLAAALAAFRTSRIDLGTFTARMGGQGSSDERPLQQPFANQPFSIMASTGFDAAVVHELTARRRGAITHWSYLPAILGQLRRWRAPEIHIALDGQPERPLGRGVLIVGNLGEYGFRIDPVRMADGRDGILDGVFLPASGGISALAWGPRFLLTRTVLNREMVGLPRFRCRSVRVRTSEPAAWQSDGDPVGSQPLIEVELGVQPAALQLLLPPET